VNHDESAFSMDRTSVASQLQRLIDEAANVAPSISRAKNGAYGEVTDNDLDAQAFIRWELECRALFEHLSSTRSTVLGSLYARFTTEQNNKSTYHSSSIFVHKVQQLLLTGLQLVKSSPLLDIPVPGALSTTETESVGPTPHRSQPEIPLPERLTLAWAWRHVPVSWLAWAIGALVTVFCVGIEVSQIEPVRELFHLKANLPAQQGTATTQPDPVSRAPGQAAPTAATKR